MDDVYGGSYNISNSFHQKYKPIINRVFKKINRFALHAYKINFIHPSTKEKMEIEAPLPNDFRNILDILF